MPSAVCLDDVVDHAELVSPFVALGLHARLGQTVQQLGFQTPTPIQEQAIPALLQGRDVLGLAATGTGKTAAFGLPLLQRLLQQRQAPAGRTAAALPQALVLVPTRELAIQVAKALQSFAAGSGLQVLAIYGGQDMRLQLRACQSGANVVVATPGRLLDHLQRRSLQLSAIDMVVLDEADEMLDRGFAEDLNDILGYLTRAPQTAMFSATLPARVGNMAQRILHQPLHIKVLPPNSQDKSLNHIRHVAYLVPPAQRAAALGRVLCVEQPQAALIFCRTRADVDSLYHSLARAGHRCEPLHGGMSQEARDKVMQRFRRLDFTLLIATDVAARGLDIEHITHVINFDMPEAPEVYVHRAGRTGRAGRAGVSVSFVKPLQRRFVQQLNHILQGALRLEELPTSSHMTQLHGQRLLAAVQQVLDAPSTASAGAPTLPPQLQTYAAQLSDTYTPLQLAAAALALAQAPAAIAGLSQHNGELGSKWGSPTREPSRANLAHKSRPPSRYHKPRRF